MTIFALDPEELAAALAPALADGAVHPSAALLEAWRQAHYAAQLASEVGKGWAEEREDDSHSSFVWQGGALHGAPIAAATPFHAALRIRDLALALEDDGGAPCAVRALAGTSFAEGLAWVRAEAGRLGGPARQAARPAPDLPPHPLAAGARFGVAPAALAELARLLAQADTVLRRIARELPDAGSPRCWPHHFDLAILAPLASGPDGTLSASLGLGLAVPEAFAASGYWYASPWSASQAAAFAPATLPSGRWVARGAGPPLGVLPLDELASLAPPTAAAALAGFLAAAVSSARGLAQAQQTAT
jgi:hypothetical protein